MTMPHLMNCPHSEEGWCLECVKQEYEQNERLIDDLHRLCQQSFNIGWSYGRNYQYEQNWNPTTISPHLCMVKSWDKSYIRKEVEETVVKFYQRS